MPKNGIKHACGDRHPDDVVHKSKKQILADVAHRGAAERDGEEIPRRSPCSNVISALSIATSAPVPMAIPTFAWVRAGASFTPSPAMATM